MEIARLVLDYLKVVVWPGAVLVIVFGFKEQVIDLLGRLRSFSGAGFDAQFSEAISDAANKVEEALQEAEVGRPAARHELRPEERRVVIDPLVSAAYADPVAGMVAAWRQVELTLYDITEREAGVRPTPITQVVDSLSNLPETVRDSLHRLRRLRNEAAHAARGQGPSAEAAVEYVTSCRDMVIWLRTFGASR
ncbi:hypothetical protein [Streptomyces sp. NPDC087856]|uniref:hypothetical protein n=1 Tax=Streptomyces sp. NPDC087856 TaxID=3365811 RepID=UPI0037FCBBD8